MSAPPKRSQRCGPLFSTTGTDKKPDHLVILVHGINTRALWMSEVKPALERSGFVVALTSFGKFSLLRFLSPLRRKQANSRASLSHLAKDAENSLPPSELESHLAQRFRKK